MIEIENLTKDYRLGDDAVPVLKGVSLAIAAGELCALVGASGSGKTTLMNIVGLLDRPSAGRYQFRGLDVSALGADAAADIRNREIGFIFQSFHLLQHLTALDNVALPLLYRGERRNVGRDLAFGRLEQVGLADRAGHRPGQLSGGQRQRVAIARALIGEPALLLADEPTGNLDSRTAEEIMDLLIGLNAALGVTLVVVTHDPAVSARCPRRILIRDGVIEDDGGFRLRPVGTAP